jgi:hypothetical protein
MDKSGNPVILTYKAGLVSWFWNIKVLVTSIRLEIFEFLFERRVQDGHCVLAELFFIPSGRMVS